MRAWVQTPEDVLRRAAWTVRPEAAQAALARLAACIVLFGCLYGAAMGAYRGINGHPGWLLQMAYSAVKVPLLLSGAFVITLPTFFVLGTLLGLRSGFARALRALVAAQAGLAIALASLAPLTLLFYASTTSYQHALLFNGVMFAAGALAGQQLFRAHLRPLVARNRAWRRLLLAWGFAYALVAIQLAWLLRPFIGGAGREVQFLRPDAWDNAYVKVWELVWAGLGL